MKRLRTGFTTGTYAAATALAAWRCLHGRRNGARIGLLFPDGRIRRVNIDGWRRSGDTAEAWAKKDAGDDVDITDGAVIRTKVRPISAADVLNEDYPESCGKALLVLRGGHGVGVSTRPGLEVPQGKWAINPTPRQMVVDNLKRAGAGRKGQAWLVAIEIDKGCELARKTLNPMLGVENGLSVLGTSGMVLPCSNAAYIKTIDILLKGARRTGCETAVLVTGGRTHRAARTRYPGLPEVAFIRIGDFIREACECAMDAGFTHLIVCCMPGKLAKYALGHEYTHAHRVALSMADVATLLCDHHVPPFVIALCTGCRSMHEFLEKLRKVERDSVVHALGQSALVRLRDWSQRVATELHLLSSDGKEWWL